MTNVHASLAGGRGFSSVRFLSILAARYPARSDCPATPAGGYSTDRPKKSIAGMVTMASSVETETSPAPKR